MHDSNVTIGVVYRCPNITKENNDHAISEVSKGDCVMPVLDNFLTQHILEPTRAERVLHIVLSSQKQLVDNVAINEQLGSSDHNPLHFNIKIKSDKTKVKQCRRDFRKGNTIRK